MAEHHGSDLNARAAARIAERRARHDNPLDNPIYAQTVRADFRAIIGIAMMEATNRASASVEAEHLLLAFLFDRTSAVSQQLAKHGLTYEAFGKALDDERAQTLAAIGISIPEPERLKAAPRVRPAGHQRFSASAKEVWERTGRQAHARRGRAQRITSADFLRSLLSLELGTVPRALVRAGFDRLALLAAIAPEA